MRLAGGEGTIVLNHAPELQVSEWLNAGSPLTPGPVHTSIVPA